MTGDDLAAIRARAEAATQGPWVTEHFPGRDDGYFVLAADASLIETFYDRRGVSPVADVKFIAAARTDVPLLVAEVEQLRGQLQALLDLCDEVQAEADYAHPGQDWEGTLGVSVVRAAAEGAGS